MNGIDIISARLLAVMAEDPQRELYQREVARLASVSIGATCQKLKKLSDNEMVSSRKAAREIDTSRAEKRILIRTGRKGLA